MCCCRWSRRRENREKWNRQGSGSQRRTFHWAWGWGAGRLQGQTLPRHCRFLRRQRLRRCLSRRYRSLRSQRRPRRRCSRSPRCRLPSRRCRFLRRWSRPGLHRSERRSLSAPGSRCPPKSACPRESGCPQASTAGWARRRRGRLGGLRRRCGPVLLRRRWGGVEQRHGSTGGQVSGGSDTGDALRSAAGLNRGGIDLQSGFGEKVRGILVIESQQLGFVDLNQFDLLGDGLRGVRRRCHRGDRLVRIRLVVGGHHRQDPGTEESQQHQKDQDCGRPSPALS